MGDLFQPFHILALVGFCLVFYVFYQVFKKPGREPGTSSVMAMVCTIFTCVAFGLLAWIAFQHR